MEQWIDTLFATLALPKVGLPAVFVPYPHHADGHQRENAREMVQCGAATVVEEAEMSPAKVIAAVRPLMRDAALRLRSARAARRIGRPDAAACVAQLVLDLSRGDLPAAAAVPVGAAATHPTDMEGSPA